MPCEKGENAVYRRCLAQAACLKRRIMHTVAPYIQHRSLLQAVRQVAAREFCGGKGAAVRRCTLSAVTAQGVCTRYPLLQARCARIYVIKDNYGAASALMMQELYRLALAAGERISISCCPLLPEGAPEHLWLPEKGVAFTVSNAYHTADFPVYCRIHTLLHIDSDALHAHREPLQRCRRQLRQAVQSAILAAQQ